MRTFSRLTWKAVELVALVAFSAMLILVVSQVMFRYVLRISVPWTEEAARWFYAWQIFLGSAVAMREGLHLRVTVLLDRITGKPRVVLDFLTALMGLAFFAGIIWGSLLMIRAVYPVEAGSFPVSTSYLYLAIPLGLFAMLWLAVREVTVAGRQIFRARRE
jgi:TRAP-type C4-dicarboxylate transport system permease small subunit